MDVLVVFKNAVLKALSRSDAGLRTAVGSARAILGNDDYNPCKRNHSSGLVCVECVDMEKLSGEALSNLVRVALDHFFVTKSCGCAVCEIIAKDLQRFRGMI